MVSSGWDDSQTTRDDFLTIRPAIKLTNIQSLVATVRQCPPYSDTSDHAEEDDTGASRLSSLVTGDFGSIPLPDSTRRPTKAPAFRFSARRAVRWSSLSRV